MTSRSSLALPASSHRWAVGARRRNSDLASLAVGRSDGRVALSILDPQNPYRHVQVRGKVTKITEEGADAHIDSLAKKYLGQDKYPFRQPGEVRVIYEIEPASFSTMG